ncbi:MAG: glycoside hydrolase, partial [Bacteroidota bacterium]|nr:glycoside hydrolase [Bacteroidota bacterium]
MKNMLIIIASAILFSCNNNHSNGEQANQPVLLSHKNKTASCVYLSRDENNKPLISWCEKDVSGKKFFFMSFFNEKKNAFDTTINVPIEQNAVFMEEGMPKVAVKSDGTVIAVYETDAPTKQNGWAGFVHYIQSFDKGRTWTQPLCVHQDTASGKTHSYAAIARLSDGEIGACWLDESLGDAKQGRSIKFAKTSGKDGFQNELLVDSFACQCCRTAISSDDKGNVSILFRDILPGSVSDIAISTSSDDGKTFR